MINSNDLTGKLALDANNLSALRQSAKQNSPEAIKAAAKQFEALFMNMVMKSMRDATPQDGMFDSEQTKMYTSMLDQQISQTLANRGVGLADALVRQLSNNKGGAPLVTDKDAQTGTEADAIQSSGKANPTRQAQIAAFQEQMRMQLDDASADSGIPSQFLVPATPFDPVQAAQFSKSNAKQAHVRAFEDRLASSAEEASRMSGIPAKFMLGQAALESGWGKHEIKNADGTPSHNLFGIKASAGWKGKVVQAATTEYVNGVPKTKIEKFRAYDSYADAFKDYASLLSKNPRYENVIASAKDAVGFAKGLQRAGYATDPNYAAKLTRILKQSFSA
jgi:flagellar protein FlgJ